jgi:hypothetical protein
VSKVQRISVLAAASLALALAGCGGFKESIGASKQGPDETAVAPRAPLVVPATFDLKAPQPGAPRPQDADTAVAAQRVLGGASQKAAPASEGEMALLTATGATKADPTIRQELRQEVREAGKRKSYADSVLFWRGRRVETGTPLDANEEAARARTMRTMRPVADTPKPEPIIEKAPDPPAPAEAAADKQEAEQKAEEEEDSGGWFDWF